MPVISDRAKRILMFIQLALELQIMRNYLALTSVLEALSAPPVVRLQGTWMLLRTKFYPIYKQFENLQEYFGTSQTLGEPFDESFQFLPLIDQVITEIKKECLIAVSEQRLKEQKHWVADQHQLADWVSAECDLVSNLATIERASPKDVYDVSNSRAPKNPKLFRRILSFFIFWPKFRKTRKVREVCEGTLIKKGNAKKIVMNQSSASLSSFFNEKINESNRKFLSINFDINEQNENLILKTIESKLQEFQSNCCYNFNAIPNAMARKFLLLEKYDEHDECLKKSFCIE